MKIFSLCKNAFVYLASGVSTSSQVRIYPAVLLSSITSMMFMLTIASLALALPTHAVRSYSEGKL